MIYLIVNKTFLDSEIVPASDPPWADKLRMTFCYWFKKNEILPLPFAKGRVRMTPDLKQQSDNFNFGCLVQPSRHGGIKTKFLFLIFLDSRSIAVGGASKPGMIFFINKILHCVQNDAERETKISTHYSTNSAKAINRCLAVPTG